MNAHEQRVTITLTGDDAISISVALKGYIRRIRKELNLADDNFGHQGSVLERARALVDDLDQIALGNCPANGLATCSMVARAVAA